MQLNFVCFYLVFYNFEKLNLFISSSSVSFSVCVFFGIFNIQDHVICNDSKFYFFLSNLDAFYLSCLIALARIFSTILKSNGENGHFILFLI